MKKKFSVFLWLIIWLIVGVAGFFISKFLYSIPFFIDTTDLLSMVS